MQAEASFNQAFKEKYALYGRMLYKIAVVHLGNQNDAEDAVQETFFKLLYKAPSFVDPNHEKAWVIRVMCNHCKNQAGGFWRKRVVKLEEDMVAVFEAEDRELLDRVLALPIKYKTAIHLYYFEGYSVKHIAKILDIGESSVKMRLQRGREMLRMEMEGGR
jgi:RNA polymerase sigma-70 factor (ECF subfamily)